MDTKKIAAIWLDSEKAIIVKNHHDQSAHEFIIVDEILHEKQVGNTSEHAANNSEQTTKAKFFKEIDKQLDNTQELYITGPGTIQEELKHFLLDTAQFKNLPITLGVDQQLSNEAFLSQVKEMYA